MNKKLILVEYSHSVERVVKFILEELNYDVTAYDTFEALKEELTNYDTDTIVISESRMPDSKGYETIEYIIENKYPLVVLADDDKELEDITFLGVAGVILKDSIDKILDDISKVLHRLERNRKCNILVVDDSKSFRLKITSLLSTHLFNIIEVQDGEKALESIRNKPDISMVITDYHMPVMDGFELTKKLRVDYSKEQLGIICITSDSKITNQFLAVGANDYLMKDFNEGEFFSRMYNNLELLERFSEIEEGKVLLEQYKKSVDKSSVVSKTDINGRITYVNDKFCELSGYSREELIGNSHNIVRHPDISSAIYRELWDTIKNKQTWRGVIRNRAKDGHTYYVDSLIMPILGMDGEIKEYMSIRHDITKVIEQENQIREHVIDPLTGMPNRLKLLEDMEKYSEDEEIILCILDIDGFNKINDFFGHTIGDKVICDVAKGIYQKLGERYKVYRIGADVYALLAINTTQILKCTNEVEESLLALEEVPIREDDKEVFFTISAGIAKGFKKDIMIFADIALKESKSKKRRISIFEDSFYNPAKFEENLLYLKKLKTAIENDKIVPYFQPIYNIGNKRIEKYECLIRMIDEDGKIISPFFFLDVAKKAKLYSKLTKIMIEKSFNMFKDNQYEFSINLTIEDILCSESVGFLVEKINEYGVANRLVLEVVESEEIENFQLINDFFDTLRELGCKIAIDDFGTGYSNFEYLAKLNVDYIKLDGSLIKNIVLDKSAYLVAKTIHDFCGNINAKSIAEFIENEEVMNKLSEIGIDYAQGYFIGKPEPELASSDTPLS